MNLLLDTHTLIVFDTAPKLLPTRVKKVIRDKKNRVFVSDVSAWEISIKFNIGKLPQVAPLYKSFQASLQIYSFESLAFTTEHALLAGQAITPHQDPFDRALVAQAMLEDLVFVTNDAKLTSLAGLTILWG